MGVMNEPVQHGVGDGRIPDGIMPFVGRDLTGDESGGDAMPVFQDLQDIPPLPVGKRCQAPVIDDQESKLGQAGQQLAVTAVTPGDVHLLKQSRQPEVVGTVAAPADAVGQGAGDVGFAGAGGTGEDHILFLPDPSVLDQGENNLADKAPRGPEVDLFGTGTGVAQLGPPQQIAQPAVVPRQDFPVNEQAEALLEGHLGVQGSLTLVYKPFRHAKELELVQLGTCGFQHHEAPPV